eukprot:TRINITY_DN5729_c0_g1_i9.p1 TRINITY_DN5729_c0_g1~~TRINITY_DN5729_c0_g1_i9.p1  ORF type:complete len:148 (-),score=13.37 TRINITY_DN5729_c0_g1_i9:234-677(-)
MGYSGSRRNAFDGVTYFGNDEVSSNGAQNDYAFSAGSSGLGKKHFKISYSINDNGYFIQDLGDGSGTFVKVGVRAPIVDGNVFTFGSHHIVVGYKHDESDPDCTICIQVYEDSHAKEQMYLHLNGVVSLRRGTHRWWWGGEAMQECG